MKVVFIAIIIIPTIVSCLISGIAHARQKVYGYPASILFGDAQKRYDVGLLPLTVLRTGVFSIIGIWAAFLLRLGTTIVDSILLGVAMGVVLSLFHTAIVWKMVRSPKMLSMILGGLFGAILGEMLGAMITVFLKIHDSEILFICSVVFSAMLFGGIIGANALKSGRKRSLYQPMIAELVSGGISIGIIVLPLIYIHFKLTLPLNPYYLGFSPHLSIIMGWLTGMSAVILHGLLYPLHCLVFVGMFRVFNFFYTKKFRLAPHVKFLLVITFLIGVVVSAVFYYEELEQAYPFLTTKRVFLSDRARSDIRSVQMTPDGSYLVAGPLPNKNFIVRLEKLNNKGEHIWEQFLTGQHSLAAVLPGTEDRYLAITKKDTYSIYILDGKGEVQEKFEKGIQHEVIQHFIIAAEERLGLSLRNCKMYADKKDEWYPDYQLKVKIFSDKHGSIWDQWVNLFVVEKQFVSGVRKYVVEKQFVSGVRKNVETLRAFSSEDYLVAGRSFNPPKKWVARFNRYDWPLGEILYEGTSSFIGLLSKGEYLTNHMENGKYRLCKFDAEGKLLWEKVFGDSSVDRIQESDGSGLWVFTSKKDELRIHKFTAKGRKIKEYAFNEEQFLMPIRLYVQSDAIIKYILAVNDFILCVVKELFLGSDEGAEQGEFFFEKITRQFSRLRYLGMRYIDWKRWKNDVCSNRISMSQDGYVMAIGHVIFSHHDIRFGYSDIYHYDRYWKDRKNIVWGLQFDPSYFELKEK